MKNLAEKPFAPTAHSVVTSAHANLKAKTKASLSVWAAFVVLLATAGLAACTSAPKIAPTALAPFKAELTLQPVWSIQADSELTASPTVDAKHNLVLLASGGGLVAYSAANGGFLWRTQNVGLVEAPLAVAQDGKSVLALVQGREAASLDSKTGKVLWRAVLPAEMYVQAASVSGVFVVLTADGRIVGIEEDSGRRRWALSRSIPALTVRGSGAIIAAGADVVIGLPGGKAVSLKASNGQVNWESGLAEVRGVNEVERIADAIPDWASSQTLGSCVSAYRHRITCLDTQGKVSFSQAMATVSSAVVTQSPSMIASIDESGELKAWAVNAGLTSPPAWIFEGLRGRKSAGLRDIAAQDGTIFVSDSLGFIHGIQAGSGKTIARMSFASGTDVKISLWAGSLAQGATLMGTSGRTVQAWSLVNIVR